jgi:capsule polysaccharide export protein KpsE/RkpR
LSPIEVEHQTIANDESDVIKIPVADLLITLWQRRRWLAKVIGIGSLVSVSLALLAFFIPNRYSSTAQLMPPEQDTFSSESMLNLIGGTTLPNLGGGLFNNRSSGATAIGVLGSRTVQDDLVNRFNLRRVYDRKLQVDARKDLAGETTFDEDKKSGIVSITVTDKDRYLARDLAQAYVDELNKLVSGLSTSTARRERMFLEERLKSVKADLDANSHALSQFSSRNATFDPAKQGQATVEAAGKLQEELTLAESQLSGLKAVYTDDNVRVREIRGRIDALQNQLQKIGGKEGTGVGVGADLKSDEIFPTVRQLPLLGYTYYDLYLRVTMDQSIYETLNKQYELAKVQEAKEIPAIKVLDIPAVAEKKSGPHRTLILAFGILLSVIGSVAWVIASKLWELADDTSAVKRNGLEIMRAIRASKSVDLSA